MGNLHCNNSIGSYVCACWEGYETFGTNCNDIDECKNINICPENASCQNIPGNFSCTCNIGFEGDLCADIDECSEENNCDENARCSNTEGSFYCYCPEGFHGDGLNCYEGSCDDRSCPTNKKCTTLTTEECQCKANFITRGNSCVDIDECLLDNDCDEHADCVNLDGSYSCTCMAGWEGDGTDCYCPVGYQGNDSLCQDIDECSTGENCVNAICLNTEGSYECVCEAGFLINSQEECVDINECELGHCEGNCTNTIGSVSCTCDKIGHEFVGESCTDFDECSANDHNCHVNATCTNIDGSFICSCNPGFLGNGTVCEYLYALVLGNTLGENANGESKWKPAMLINSLGRQKNLSCLNRKANVTLEYACPIAWKNKLYLFGGKGTEKLIRQVDGHRLNLAVLNGTQKVLYFEFYRGTCGIISESIFLCFSYDYDYSHLYSTKEKYDYSDHCFWASGPLENFKPMPSSNYKHRYTQISDSSSKYKP